MSPEPLHNAILRILNVCDRKRNGAAGGWREVEDLAFAGLADARLDRGPRIHVRDFMGMPPDSEVPGVAYRTRGGFAHLRVGRTNEIREECLAAYRAEPGEQVEHDPPGMTYPAVTSLSTPVGQVVDVVILVDYVPRPSGVPATGGFMHQGTFVETAGDFGIHPKV